jgi:hypothetical protein
MCSKRMGEIRYVVRVILSEKYIECTIPDRSIDKRADSQQFKFLHVFTNEHC